MLSLRSVTGAPALFPPLAAVAGPAQVANDERDTGLSAGGPGAHPHVPAPLLGFGAFCLLSSRHSMCLSQSHYFSPLIGGTNGPFREPPQTPLASSPGVLAQAL